MGYYINKDLAGNGLPASGKARHLVNDGAAIIDAPTEFKENLVCVVDNGMFEAAAFAHSESEMKEFLTPDGRPKIWLEYSPAAKLSGFLD